MTHVHRFESARAKWWGKPLVKFRGQVMPAELAVLALEQQSGERGAWLNSRSTKSGVVGLKASVSSVGVKYTTQRESLPSFVVSQLAALHQEAGQANGRPDLVLWRSDLNGLRFVEVKCPHWDHVSPNQ
jgi:hypothetical protein